MEKIAGAIFDTMAHKYKISKPYNIVWHWHSNITDNSNYNWHIVSSYLLKSEVGLLTQKNPMWQVGKILKMWGEKAIARIAIFSSFGVW